jgi:hypothetical protein
MNILDPKKFQRWFSKQMYGYWLDCVTPGSQSVSQQGDPSESIQPVYPHVSVCCPIFSYDILQDDNIVIRVVSGSSLVRTHTEILVNSETYYTLKDTYI